MSNLECRRTKEVRITKSQITEELGQSSGALAMEASQPKAPEDWRSPRRYRAIRRFMVPMRAGKRIRAFHEPGSAGIPAGGLQACVSPARTPALPETAGFKVPMQAQKRKGALHEPAGFRVPMHHRC